MVPDLKDMLTDRLMILRILNKRRESKNPIPRVDESERVYAIGDVHGRHDLLLALFKRIYDDAMAMADHRTVRVVLLGDYVDRGDDSAKVLDALERSDTDESSSLICLRGNHEEAMLDFLNDPVRGRAWLDYGAAQTMASYGVTFPAGTDDKDLLIKARDALADAMGPQLGFLKSLRTHFQSGDVLFTHAGINPEDAETLVDTHAMLWGNSACMTPNPVPGLRLVHGHYDDMDPQIMPGRVCIDTGAYYSGVLTALRLDDGQEILTASAKDLVY